MVYYNSTYTMPVKLFITISPPNRTFYYSKLKFNNPNFCVFLDDKNCIQAYFKKGKINDYVIYPEFDKLGRLHYHGRVSVSPSQKVTLFKSIIPKLERTIGFVKVEPVIHEVSNLLYCMKGWAYTQQMLDITEPIRVYGSMPLKKKKTNIMPEDISILDYFG